jgi:hypothetical protein
MTSELRSHAMHGNGSSRHPLVIYMVWGAPILTALLVAFVARHDYVFDAGVFLPAGRTLLSAHWSRTFADPAVQAGPIELVLYGGADLLGRASGLPFQVWLGLFVSLAIVPSVVAITGSMFRESSAMRVAQFVAGMGAALVLVRHTLDSGHPAEVAIPLMWAFGVIAVRRGRFMLAGVLLGLSAGWELWGVLGAPVALLATDKRSSLKVSGVQSATTLASFAPFFLFGSVHTFQNRWFVTVQSPLSLIVPAGTTVTWEYRLVQGIFAVCLGGVVARVARRSSHALWEVPAAVITGRFLLEPVNFRYYWLAIWSLALIAVVDIVAGWVTAQDRKGSTSRGPSERVAVSAKARDQA